MTARAKPIPTALIDAEAFETLLMRPDNANRRLELIHGEVYEKMPTEEHGVIVATLIFWLRAYLQTHRIGRVGTEFMHRAPDDNANVRLPDIAFRRAQEPLVTQGSVWGMPDLAVEVQLPRDTVKSLREKARYYLTHGARMVWLVFPNERIVEVYTLEEERILTLDGVLDGGELLPDFRLPVRDIFDDTTQT